MDFDNFINYVKKYYPSIICTNIKLIDKKILGILKKDNDIIGIKNNGRLCRLYIPEYMKNNNKLPQIKGDIEYILKNINKIRKAKYLNRNYMNYNHDILYDNNKILPIKNNVDITNVKKSYDDQVNKIKRCQEKIVYEKDVIIKAIEEYKMKINKYLKTVVNVKECDKKIQEIYIKMSLENEQLKDKLDELKKTSFKCNEHEKMVYNSESIKEELDNLKKELDVYKMKLIVIEGYKEKCKEKILNEKNIIINKIKEYNNAWKEWVNRNDIKTENTIKYINKLITDYNILEKNLKIVKAENDNHIKFKQNVKDIQLELKTTINKQIKLLNEKDLIINNLNEEQKDLKKELEKIKKLLNDNVKDTKILYNSNSNIVEYDYNKCYDILKSFVILNNILWRKIEIIKKIDGILKNGNLKLDEKYIKYIYDNFYIIKNKIIQYIKFLNLEKYINSPNLQYLKSNSTKHKVPFDFCNDIINILNYWNENKQQYKIEEQILENIYEDISGSVRVYIRIKPLLGIDQKENSIITKNDMLTIKCGSKNKSFDFNTDNIYDDTLLNINIYTGNYGISDNETLYVDESKVEINSIYNIFKQLESGYNVLMFSYGVSGSGKTLTLLGNNGVKGLVHYGIHNLKNVKNIKIKNVFEQYVSNIDLNFKTIRGKIYNLINYIKELGFNSKDETDKFKKYFENSDIDIDDINTDDFVNLTKIIEEYRIDNERIKKTIFNSVSSRSHLYIILKITFYNGNVGYLTIVDMAGKESPIDIYNRYINSKKTTIESIMSPEIGKGLVEKYMKSEFYETYSPKKILDIIKEGFYINETLNHLIYYFQKINGNNDKINMQKSLLYNSNNFFVNPKTEENYINNGNNCLTIPILNYITNLGKDSYKPTKYVMICNIRQEEFFCEQTIESLEFVKKINPIS